MKTLLFLIDLALVFGCRGHSGSKSLETGPESLNSFFYGKYSIVKNLGSQKNTAISLNFLWSSEDKVPMVKLERNIGGSSAIGLATLDLEDHIEIQKASILTSSDKEFVWRAEFQSKTDAKKSYGITVRFTTSAEGIVYEESYSGPEGVKTKVDERTKKLLLRRME